MGVRVPLIFIGLLVLAGLAYGGATKLGSVIKYGAERSAPDILGTSFSVDDIALDPISGKATVTGLVLGQPEGFGEGAMLSLDRFDIDLETSSLLSNHIIINTISVEAPRLAARVKGRASNFEKLADRLRQQAPVAAEDAPPSETTITIHRIDVKRPTLALATEDGLLTLDDSVDLAGFAITNLGTDEEGLAPPEIARHIMDVMQPQIAKAMISLGAKGAAEGLVRDARGGLEKGVKGLLSGLKKNKDDN